LSLRQDSVSQVGGMRESVRSGDENRPTGFSGRLP
jgi:hypothetical protein